MTRIHPLHAASIACLLASVAHAQDTRGVRIIDPTEQAPAPVPTPTPIPTPTPRPVPVTKPTPTSRPAPRPMPTATPVPTPSPTTTPSPTPTAAPTPRATPTAAVKPAAACVRAFAQVDMAYGDSASSRRRLADLLKKKPQRVTLDVAPFASETPPTALAPWLAEVRESGGEVTEKDIVCTRGFSLGRLFKSLFGGRDPNADYATIRGYDATLWIDKGEGLVRQIELLKRGE